MARAERDELATRILALSAPRADRGLRADPAGDARRQRRGSGDASRFRGRVAGRLRRGGAVMSRRPAAPPANAAPTDERLAVRRRWLLGGIGMAALLIVGRAVQLQGFQGERWRHRGAQAAAGHRAAPGAPRRHLRPRRRAAGAHPRDLRRLPGPARGARPRRGGPPAGARAGAHARRGAPGDGPEAALGRPPRPVQRGAAPRAGRPARRLRGARLERFYPQGDVGREVLGGVSGDGRAQGGIEQAMDSLLRGKDGFSVLRRDARGRKEASVSLPARAAARRRRRGAHHRLRPAGDRRRGAHRAGPRHPRGRRRPDPGRPAHRRDPGRGLSKRGGSRDLSAFIEPYEPGSTAQALLRGQRCWRGGARRSPTACTPSSGTLDDAEGPHGDRRAPLRVAHPARRAARAQQHRDGEVLARLPRAEQYAYAARLRLRHAPRGWSTRWSPSGRLPRPTAGSSVTPASLAMGYEVSVTPLQMAMAYGAMANGGMLMEPRLVREVRDAEGSVVERREPRAVRRVIPADGGRRAARRAGRGGGGRHGDPRLAGHLRGGGEDGDLRAGPARAGATRRGSTTPASSASFPAHAPQLVIYVKLDRPQGDYYGGLTAAPVTRATLQAILAARSPSLDRRALLGIATSGRGPAAARAWRRTDEPAPGGREGTYVFLDNRAARAAAPTARRRRCRCRSSPGCRCATPRGGCTRWASTCALRGGGTVKAPRRRRGAVLPRGDTLTLLGEGGMSGRADHAGRHRGAPAHARGCWRASAA